MKEIILSQPKSTSNLKSTPLTLDLFVIYLGQCRLNKDNTTSIDGLAFWMTEYSSTY